MTSTDSEWLFYSFCNQCGCYHADPKTAKKNGVLQADHAWTEAQHLSTAGKAEAMSFPIYIEGDKVFVHSKEEFYNWHRYTFNRKE